MFHKIQSQGLLLKHPVEMFELFQPRVSFPAKPKLHFSGNKLPTNKCETKSSFLCMYWCGETWRNQIPAAPHRTYSAIFQNLSAGDKGWLQKLLFSQVQDLMSLIFEKVFGKEIEVTLPSWLCS